MCENPEAFADEFEELVLREITHMAEMATTISQSEDICSGPKDHLLGVMGVHAEGVKLLTEEYRKFLEASELEDRRDEFLRKEKKRLHECSMIIVDQIVKEIKKFLAAGVEVPDEEEEAIVPRDWWKEFMSDYSRDEDVS